MIDQREPCDTCVDRLRHGGVIVEGRGERVRQSGKASALLAVASRTESRKDGRHTTHSWAWLCSLAPSSLPQSMSRTSHALQSKRRDSVFFFPFSSTNHCIRGKRSALHHGPAQSEQFLHISRSDLSVWLPSWASTLRLARKDWCQGSERRSR